MFSLKPGSKATALKNRKEPPLLLRCQKTILFLFLCGSWKVIMFLVTPTAKHDIRLKSTVHDY